jgi:hypothetical protein
MQPNGVGNLLIRQCQHDDLTVNLTTGDCSRPQSVRQVAGILGVAVDDSHLVAAGDGAGGDAPAHVAGADDRDPHYGSPR